MTDVGSASVSCDSSWVVALDLGRGSVGLLDLGRSSVGLIVLGFFLVTTFRATGVNLRLGFPP
jgi:hypothetical protein